MEDVSTVIILYPFIKLLLHTDFGQGTGPIHRTEVTCQGFEPNLFTCPARSNTTSCDHSLDAGVICISMLLHKNIVCYVIA